MYLRRPCYGWDGWDGAQAVLDEPGVDRYRGCAFVSLHSLLDIPIAGGEKRDKQSQERTRARGQLVSPEKLYYNQVSPHFPLSSSPLHSPFLSSVTVIMMLTPRMQARK